MTEQTSQVTPPSKAKESLLPSTESKIERLPFASVSSTGVIGPEIIEKVKRAIGDGLGGKNFQTEDMLKDIAFGKKTWNDLDTLAEKSTQESSKESLHQGASADLQAAGFVQRFIGIAFSVRAARKHEKHPKLWMKVFFLNEKPYIVVSLEKPQISFMQMAFGRGSDQKSDRTPRYDAGVLDDYYPHGALYQQENFKHPEIGSFELRLAAIIDDSRKVALEDFLLDPDKINVVVKPQEAFPEGRLCTIIPKKPLVRSS